MSHLIALVFNDQFKGEEARVPAPEPRNSVSSNTMS
jgi:hypothetical protein